MAGNSTDGIAAAAQLAKASDVVVLCVGVDDTQEREGLDRVITTLPGVQTQLVDAVLEANANVVVVLFNGGAMTLGPIKERAKAIVDAFYGGEMGSQALADVIFGEYNPSGKLAATMYPLNKSGQLDAQPLTEMSVTKAPGRTHMFYTGEPEFAFGTGLSYTSWEMEWSPSSKNGQTLTPGGKTVNVEVALTNAGEIEGRQTLLFFWRPTTATVSPTASDDFVPLKRKLIGYAGTGSFVQPGETRTLSVAVSHEDFALAHGESNGKAVVAPGGYELFVVDGAGGEVMTTVTLA